MFLVYTRFISDLKENNGYSVWDSDTFTVYSMLGREIMSRILNGDKFINVIYKYNIYTLLYPFESILELYEKDICRLGDATFYADTSKLCECLYVEYKNEVYKVKFRYDTKYTSYSYASYIPIIKDNKFSIVHVSELGGKYDTETEVSKQGISPSQFKRMLLLNKNKLFKEVT